MTLSTDTVGSDIMAITTPKPVARAPRATHVRRGPIRKTLSVFSTIATVLVVMVAAVALVVAIATRFSSKGQYTVFGHPVAIVLSGSMTPVIDTGDLIVDNPVNSSQAKHLDVGQIITFREAPGSPTTFTHRIVRVTSVQGQVAYITKGDANNAPDTSPRLASQVVGVFRYAIPRGGYALNALHNPLVLGLLLASPVLWFLAGPLFQLARDMDDPGKKDLTYRADDAGANAP